uniref:Uncharacterized protein n=1 Tax=Sinocyclocheilus grahami TaxID=75366 RepID=A0A672LIR2_SINGR
RVTVEISSAFYSTDVNLHFLCCHLLTLMMPLFTKHLTLIVFYCVSPGEEVALYCSKFLPDIIKEQKAYKDGKLQKALEEAFLAIDARITTEEVIKELVQIAGRPRHETEKVADEDDGYYTIIQHSRWQTIKWEGRTSGQRQSK